MHMNCGATYRILGSGDRLVNFSGIRAQTTGTLERAGRFVGRSVEAEETVWIDGAPHAIQALLNVRRPRRRNGVVADEIHIGDRQRPGVDGAEQDRGIGWRDL